MSKTVLFQTIHFSINRDFRSIWSIDRILLGATFLGQSGTEGLLRARVEMKDYSTFPKTPALQEPHYQIV